MRSTAPFAVSAAPAEAGHGMNAGAADTVEKFTVADTSGSRKRRKILFAFLSGLILLTFALYEFLSLDGIAGIVFPLMFPDSTVYSEQWNYWSFRFVRKGMSVADVMEMLGPPIRQWDNVNENGEVETRFAYTVSSSNSHFRIRQVVFRNGRVVSKFHEYYVD